MRKTILATAAVLMTLAGNAFAAEVGGKMLNKGTEGMLLADATPFAGKGGEDVAGLFDKLAASKTVEK
jgi:hypothetical protein